MKKNSIWLAIFCLIAVLGTTVGCGESRQLLKAVPDIQPTELLDWNVPSDWIVPDKYVIDFEDDLDEEEINEVLGVYSLYSQDGPYWEEMKMEIVTVHDGNRAALEYLAKHEDIEGVEPLYIVKALTLKPNDPLYEKQWHMKRIGVESAWHYSIGRGVTVAIIDTGVACDNYSHFHKASDLQQTECVPGYNFIANNKHANDDNSHGTHVAGTVAQSTNNKVGGVGVAFGVKIMPVKVLSGSGNGTLAGVAAGIRWAADNGAQVMNLSLGGPSKSAVLQRAVNHARSKGVVVVAAAGNSGGSVGYPGGCDGVIGVSATDESNNLASFSSRGPEVDIGAPGVNVIQNTICDGGRNNCEDFPALRGTSMASPHVAGVAALLVGQGITDPDTIESYITSSAKTLDTSRKGREYYGAGLLQGSSAVQQAHWTQSGFRALFLLLLSFFTFKLAEMKGKTFSIKSPTFWVAGVLTGVGAFVLPLLLSRHNLLVDFLSRPIGDWSILLDVSLHKYLPFANALIPIIPAALFLKSHKGAGQWIGGMFVGTAAYLCSTVLLGHLSTPFGWFVTTAWCLANAALCVYIGSLVLLRPQPEKA